MLRSLRFTCSGHKARDNHTITPEERGVERGSARLSSLKGRERASSVRRTLELFQRQLLETSVRQGGAHMDFSERIDTILS